MRSARNLWCRQLCSSSAPHSQHINTSTHAHSRIAFVNTTIAPFSSLVHKLHWHRAAGFETFLSIYRHQAQQNTQLARTGGARIPLASMPEWLSHMSLRLWVATQFLVLFGVEVFAKCTFCPKKASKSLREIYIYSTFKADQHPKLLAYCKTIYRKRCKLPLQETPHTSRTCVHRFVCTRCEQMVVERRDTVLDAWIKQKSWRRK